MGGGVKGKRRQEREEEEQDMIPLFGTYKQQYSKDILKELKTIKQEMSVTEMFCNSCRSLQSINIKTSTINKALK